MFLHDFLFLKSFSNDGLYQLVDLECLRHECRAIDGEPHVWPSRESLTYFELSSIDQVHSGGKFRGGSGHDKLRYPENPCKFACRVSYPLVSKYLDSELEMLDCMGVRIDT